MQCVVERMGRREERINAKEIACGKNPIRTGSSLGLSGSFPGGI